MGVFCRMPCRPTLPLCTHRLILLLDNVGLVIAAAHPSRQPPAVNNNRIRIREDFSATPLCPHCGREIRELAARRVESMLGVRFLYYCCECHKVLGVSHRKGFWMG